MAIPGFVNVCAWFKVDTDKPGLYRGQCAELVRPSDHGFMTIVVRRALQGGLRDLAQGQGTLACRSQAAATLAPPPRVTPGRRARPKPPSSRALGRYRT